MFDTPGLGADDVEEDLHNLQQILNLIKDLRKVKTQFLKRFNLFIQNFAFVYLSEMEAHSARP